MVEAGAYGTFRSSFEAGWVGAAANLGFWPGPNVPLLCGVAAGVLLGLNLLAPAFGGSAFGFAGF